MLPFAEARERILQGVSRLGSERVPLRTAAGRVLAEDVRASEPLPRFDYSAMDGYALGSADVTATGPWVLPLHGESRAGAPLARLEPGTICRIFTGAALPPGADAVVASEDAEEHDGRVELAVAPRPGQHVRRRGEDLAQGELALAAGVRLGAYHVGVAAGVDRPDLLVARRPRVTIVGTGDELRAPGEAGSPTSIPESNGLSIAILAESAGASVLLAPRIADDAETLRERLARALEQTDLLVTIGGVSIGRYDLVRPALEAAGAQLDFWQVQIKPGKPLVYGRYGNTRILGLPGNPVSAQLTFGLFGLPLLRALQGQRDPVPPFESARLLAALRQRPGRMGFYRARWTPLGVLPVDNQASGNVLSLAYADALIAVPADSEGYDAGALVDILRLSQL
ncbi:MAG: gephyrin-like molybdotransferase Glp [Deltaproteobacteria bacterium]